MTPKSVARELFAFGVGKEKKVKPKTKKISRLLFTKHRPQSEHFRLVFLLEA